MSLVIEKDGRAVHYPKKPDHFEFDDEVAPIFEQMADRSIPLYREVHTIHAALAKHYIQSRMYGIDGIELEGDAIGVLDIGSSTGMFFKALSHAFDIPVGERIPNVHGLAIDNSDPMNRTIRETLPWVDVLHMDATDLDRLLYRPSVVNVSYLIQFLPPIERMGFIHNLANVTAPGGMVFVAQKEAIAPEYSSWFAEEYLKFRRRNGYTDDEIAAKTHSLRTSMWVDQMQYTKALFKQAGFRAIQETTRWLSFSSFVCVR